LKVGRDQKHTHCFLASKLIIRCLSLYCGTGLFGGVFSTSGHRQNRRHGFFRRVCIFERPFKF
jgi:hypothetical protein